MIHKRGISLVFSLSLVIASPLFSTGCETANDRWKGAQQEDTVQAYESFLDSDPTSRWADEARNRVNLLHWPPLPLPAEDVSLDSGTGGFESQIEGWQSVYVDLAKTRRKGWGPNAVNGSILLNFNLFSIGSPGDCFVDNSFAVLRYDTGHTLIQLDRDRGDRLCIMYLGMSPDGFEIENTAVCKGSKVRYAGRVYEIRGDGWYCQERLVHAFGPESS